MPATLSLSLTRLDWVICIGMLLFSIFFGLWMSARSKSGQSSAGFFLAGRSLTWPIVGLSLYSTNIGAEHLVGLSGDAYRYGIKVGAVELTTAICLGLACWLLFPAYIKSKVFTIPEFLERRYDVRARIAFSAYMLTICVMTKMAFTFFAGAMVVHSLVPTWDTMHIVAVMSMIAALITIFGGFTAVAYTDAIQSCIIIFGCGAMLFFGLHQVGGWDQLMAQAAPKMHVAAPANDPNFPFWGIILCAAYGGIFYWGMDQVNVQRVLGARDLRQGRLGAMFAIVLKFSPIFIFAVPGVIAYALFPDLDNQEAKQTFVMLLNKLLPTGLRGLVFSALIAAIIASKLSVMNSVSTLTVRDILMRFKPDMNDREQVRYGRISVVFFAILGVLAAWFVMHTQEGIYKYLQTVSVYLIFSLTPTIFFGVVNKRVNMKGAIASVLVGVSISILCIGDMVLDVVSTGGGKTWLPFLHKTFTENYTYRGLWATMIVTAVLFIVSYATPPPTPEQQSVTYDWWRKHEPFQGLHDWRLHLAALSCVTVFIYHWLW